MKRILILFQILVCICVNVPAQDADQNIISSIYREALTDRTAYDNLRILCKQTRGRVTGSAKAEEAVRLTFRMMQELGSDTVYLQPVGVPHWERGKKEVAYLVSRKTGKQKLSVAALGMSAGTGRNGLRAQVIEVKSLDDLAILGKERISSKIVFFNRPMDPVLMNTFAAYGGAGDQRTAGAAVAAEFGASGVIVRSLTTSLDDYPHTGVLRYRKGAPEIPAVAVSTTGAELLSRRLQEDPALKLYFRTGCRTLPDVTSANVIGEIRGTQFPDQIITVGGHLDAWDLGEGAHDDATGCIQAMEVLRIMKKLGIRPKRTIRAVMFMDEEIAQRGGAEYARQAELKGEKHFLAIESDRGGLLPVGIGISASQEFLKKLTGLNRYFEPYGIGRIMEGGGGVDVNPLRKSGTPVGSLIPDQQRYFDYHHSANDTFEKVSFRELQLGSAAITALIYLADNQ